MPQTWILAALLGVAPAAGEKPQVVLTLDAASAQRLSNGDVLFKCRLTLENNTGAPLKVRSRFFSAFDGLSLVIQSEGGKELTRQPYVFHQAPMAETQEYPLPVGKTTEEIRFPVGVLLKGTSKFTVRVVGTLPGSGYEPEVASPAKAVRVGAD